MGCPNFETQDLFPLYVLDHADYYYKRCDECGEEFSADEYDECPYCGEWLGDERFDEYLWEDDFDSIRTDLKKENNHLNFFEIQIVNGYWADAQLIVNLTRSADYCGFDIDGDTDCVCNDCTKLYYNCCRSECIRRFNVEINKVRKIMKKIKEEHFMIELGCCGIFSNGEAIYNRVDSGEREKMLAAAKAV